MHIIQEEIGLPKIKIESSDPNHAVFTISPLPSGYGMTLGNAFRRVLLWSLPGAAITSVKIDGVTHEYATLSGVQDSVLDIILNLKELQLKKHSKEPEVIKLIVNKEGDVLAKDIEQSIETNGSITPEDSLKFAASVLKSYFDLSLIEEEEIEADFRSDRQQVKAKEMQEEEEESKKETYTPIEILNFSPRTLNSLINGGIGSIEQLVKCTPSKLGNFRGFGKKAMTEVSEALATRSLKLMDEKEF